MARCPSQPWQEPYNLGDDNAETKWLDYSSNAFFVRRAVATNLD